MPMKLKYILIFTFIILQGAFHTLFSQTTDSLLSLEDNITKLNLLKNAAIKFSEDAPDKSIMYANEGIRLGNKLSNTIVTAEFYKVAGIAYDIKGNLDSALFYLNHAKRIFLNKGQIALLSNTISDIALAYYFRGIYELSLTNNFEALGYREKLGDKSLIAKSFNNIGLVYRVIKDYPKAVEYYKKSLLIKEELKDTSGILNTLINIGSTYQFQLKYDSALLYGHKTLVLAKLVKNSKDVVNSHANIGLAQIGLADWKNAERNLNQALIKANEIDYLEPLYSIYEGIGRIKMSNKQYNSAIEWFNKGVNLSSERNRKEMLASFYSNLSECYEKMGNYKFAYNYNIESTSIKDSLLNVETFRQINEFNTIYKTTEKENEILLLSEEGRQKEEALIRSKRERKYLILAIIFFSVFTGFIFYAYRNNKLKKEKINKQKEIIEKSLKEKEVLLREIHHRVKNNLQIISGLLNLQSRQIENTEAQEAVREGRNRVKSIALLHQKLYQQENLTGVDMMEYIQDLSNTIQQTIKDEEKDIQVEINCNNLTLDVDTAIPLGLIINELLTNSFKYAFTDKTKGKILLHLNEVDDKLILLIKDDGKGFPNDFDLTKAKSFGMKLLQSLSIKLKAEVEIKNDNGAILRLIINNYKKY